ncbi:MAG: DUF975 family protein [Oscillospiraceae bacterium]|nr:DUF975 family protein [Oscillospiraceae bacterium]
MWTNSMLKQNGWNSVKPYYWTAFGVCIVSALLGGNSGGGFNFGAGAGSGTEQGTGYDTTMDPEVLIGFVIGFLVAFVFIMAFAMAIYAFLGGVVRAGECKFFRMARTGDVNFGYLFDNFQGGRYMKTVKVMFNTYIKIFLWSLLFYIPGLIKTYEYFLVSYLVSENADLSKERVQEISRQTMNGEKWKLFVLQFSFIGWMLLGAMACGFGVLFVMPYYEATMAEFYACMRAKMLSLGITTEEELSGYFNTPNSFQNYGNQPQNSYNPYDMNQNYNQNQNQNYNPYDMNQNYNQNQNYNPYDMNQNYNQNPGSRVDLDKSHYNNNDDNNNNNNYY